MRTEKYAPCRGKLANMHEAFKIMLAGHLGQINGTKHSTELKPPNSSRIHSVQYGASPKVENLDQKNVSGLLNDKVTEPS